MPSGGAQSWGGRPINSTRRLPVVFSVTLSDPVYIELAKPETGTTMEAAGSVEFLSLPPGHPEVEITPRTMLNMAASQNQGSKDLAALI